MNVGREQGQDEEDEEDELYRDVNINIGRGMESIFETTSQMDVQSSTSVAPLPVSARTLTPLTIATITTTLQVPTPPTTALSTLLQDLPNFSLLFGFDHRLKKLEANFFEFKQTNQFARAVSSIPGIVHRYMDQRMNEVVKVAIQLQSNRLRDEAQKENNEFLKTINENMQKIVKEQTSYVVATDLSEMELTKILIEKIEGNKSIHRSNEQRNLYKALVEAYESDKIILDIYGDTVTLKRRRDDVADKVEEPSAGSDWGSKICADDQPIVEPSQHPEWFSQQKKPPTLDCDWNKTLPATHEIIQPWISELAKQFDSRSSFNELMDTHVDFSNFLMNRLKVDTLTPELLAGPTYELMKGSCKSLVELEFFLEEVYKAMIDQLDWVNPEGQQYPHNLLKPLPLIPNSRGHHVIPFDHFINNDLEYLRGGASSRKYTTSVTKTKAADYGHIKRVEDLQLGVESYQKKLNLTKSDTYRSDLKRKEAYIAYSNPRGFIYQNKDKQNRLMRIDELHKFSDGTLTDVLIALDDLLKGIRMKYLQQSIWRKNDKDRIAAMIQAIDKRLKTRRIKRSLERYRYSNPMIQPEPEGSTQGYPLISVEVLRYDKKSKSENIGIVPTEMELILEHTQQGISHEVSISTEGVEE
nr:hypothetical protein [Tanacetum cinerariifolium]